ncbi:hypothetical protein LJB42_004013 [Komagataella kurtzmanii]|nr:hypothetical protein LJB42_004013 [Komagataella kurtzmanii]
MSLKGFKKAIIRTPFQLLERKTVEDQTLKEWDHDLDVSVSGLTFLTNQLTRYRKISTEILNDQIDIVHLYKRIHRPLSSQKLDPKDNQLSFDEKTQETFETDKEFDDSYRLMYLLQKQVIDRVSELETSVKAQCKKMAAHIHGVRSLIKKRNHKKVDYEMSKSNVQKIISKKDHFAEKDIENLEKNQAQMDVALETFLEFDDKIRLIVPQCLEYLSEFLNKITLKCYYEQLSIDEYIHRKIHEFSVANGIVKTDGKSPDFSTMTSDWEDQIVPIMVKIENLELIKSYQHLTNKNFLQRSTNVVKEKTLVASEKSVHTTGAILTKLSNTNQNFSFKSGSIENPVKPAHPEGIFWKPLDPFDEGFFDANLPTDTANEREKIHTPVLESSKSWMRPLSLKSDQPVPDINSPVSPVAKKEDAEEAEEPTHSPITETESSAHKATKTELYKSIPNSKIAEALKNQNRSPQIVRCPVTTNLRSEPLVNFNLRDYVASRSSITSFIFCKQLVKNA